MAMQSLISRYPGTRIQGYRNSAPRFVKVVAMGPEAEAALSALNRRERGNILMSGRVQEGAPVPMDAPVDGVKPHAVIIVHQQGEATAFPFLVERTASMLSLVVLETAGALDEQAENQTMRQIRALADLFVTTSDRDFIQELVDNLAS
jgi:hypothetical protein